MGGNLLQTKRISKQEYNYLFPIGKDNFFIPRSLSDKQDFGDIDVILKSTACSPSWEKTKDSILRDLNITKYESFQSGLSVLYNDFSVDFFCMDAKKFNHAYYFLSYNCLGNLIGKIAKRLELKFGEAGLSYVFRRENSSYKRDFLICDDFELICNFFGLDYKRWQEGFTYETMFQWVMESPFFSTDVYLDPKGNLKKRLENERPAIVKFANYLKEKKITKNFVSPYSHDDIIGIVDGFFGTYLSETIEKEKERECVVNEIQKKFNGNLLIELLGISGKELGNFINNYKKGFATDQFFENFILEADQKKINNNIKNFYNEHKRT